MKADTTGYVGLQSLYKGKAKEDLKLVNEILGEVLSKAGVSRERVSEEEVETFVKHSAFLKVVRGRSLRMEEEESLVKGNLGALAYCFVISRRALTFPPSWNRHAPHDLPIP